MLKLRVQPRTAMYNAQFPYCIAAIYIFRYYLVIAIN